MRLIRLLQQLLREDRGATAVEYGLIVAMIVIACIGAFDAVANENNGLWAVVSNRITTAAQP